MVVKQLCIRKSLRPCKVSAILRTSISKFFNELLAIPVSIHDVIMARDLRNASVLVLMPMCNSNISGSYTFNSIVERMLVYINDSIITDKAMCDNTWNSKKSLLLLCLNSLAGDIRSYVAKDVYLKQLPQISFQIVDYDTVQLLQ